MMSAKEMVKIMIVLCAICFFAKSDGKTLQKKTVGEIQLMNDRRQYLNKKERQEWLQKLLQEVNTAGAMVPKDDVSRRSLRKEDNVLFESHQKRLAEADKADVDVLTKVKSQ
ncbi:PREDICTED: parathyroid hormone-like [Myotis davidii]|uniref:parathyroid hormone-like n=1 Tax=Myotis davidii TaxID=225400 RepID=UPI0003EC3E5C|nr:PREDICTED: parathyroid hormone-like [Myotis davidii]